MSLHEKLTSMKKQSETVSIELTEKTNQLVELEKKHQQQEETQSKKVYKLSRNSTT